MDVTLSDGRLTALQKKEDQQLAEERQRLKWQKDHMYDDVHQEDNMVSNEDFDEDDFM